MAIQMARYQITVTTQEAEDEPETYLSDIIIAKFQSEHGVVVDESMIVESENEFFPDHVKIVAEVP